MTEESNEHFWNCSQLFPITKERFKQLANHLTQTLIKHADKASLTAPDTLKFSDTFGWCLNELTSSFSVQQIPFQGLLLLRSYVSMDLYNIFRLYFLTQTTLLRIYSNF